MGLKYDALMERLREVHNIRMATAVLGWDQQTQMPPGGSTARAHQLATLSRIQHELFTDAETGQLLDDAAAELQDMDYGSDEVSMVRVVTEDYEDATKLPAEFVTEVTRETTLAHEVWVKARQDDDFAYFLPTLEKMVGYARQAAEYLGYEEHPYDALLGQYERGMTTDQVKEIFDTHKPGLIELIAAIAENADRADDAPVRQHFPQDKQLEFALDMVKHYGFNFDRGVQAVSVHPFCTSFSKHDVRITTRFEDNFLNPALFGMMHEAGHAMYEQGVGESLAGTPLESGTSLGVHESQSRMWENIIGRSYEFWTWAFPQAQAAFPDQLGSIDLDTFYRAINTVKPSLIRVEADEATYNLHIMIRFEIEVGLMTGEYQVADLPEIWNTKFEEYLGIVPPNDTLGVLQDVHWSSGLLGYFPTYALGNLLSSQYYNKMLADHPNIPNEIASGKFDTILMWLNENIHQHGRKFTGDELTRKVTGEGIQSRDYLQYLQTKFSSIYEL